MSYLSKVSIFSRNKNKSKNRMLDYYIKLRQYLSMFIPYPMKSYYNTTIPLNVYQTWHTHDLPPKMSNAVKYLKYTNPAFTFHLFDDNDCREFIKSNYPDVILNTFDKLKPGAYQADLFRYCILYTFGGIYLDIKYVPFNYFKLINLTETEHWVLDTDNNGIYNALMVLKKGNPILLKAIYQIVENVNRNYYGQTALDVTGPGLLANFFNQQQKKYFDMKHVVMQNDFNQRYIMLNNHYIFKSYPGYLDDHNRYKIKEYYGNLWNSRQIYN
jgi:mannosyltransferase OCH1-like enzyme